MLSQTTSSMPLLFSYGTLQDERVQLSTFGRRLEGEMDALPGYQPALVPVRDPATLASGRTHHDNVTPARDEDQQVRGTVFEVTDDELAAADGYEAPYDYARTAVTLASGKRAWVYVHRGGDQR